jgi:hypothetical protein
VIPEEELAAAARELAAAAADRAAARSAERAATARVRRTALHALDVGMSWRRAAELGGVHLSTLQDWHAQRAETGRED